MGRFAKALEEVRLMKAGKLGCSRTRVAIAPVDAFNADHVKAIRKAARMTQEAFAACMGVSKKTVEAWEGGRSNPDGTARRLLGLVRDNPFFFEECGVYERIHENNAELPKDFPIDKLPNMVRSANGRCPERKQLESAIEVAK